MSDKFKIRGLRPSDIPLITSTWLRTYRKASRHATLTMEGCYYSEHNKLINKSFDAAQVYVACDPHEPDHVFAYLVGVNRPKSDVVHYVYTKGTFRQMGICKALLDKFQGAENLYNTHENLPSGLFKHLKNRYDRVIFNPYMFMNPNFFSEV